LAEFGIAQARPMTPVDFSALSFDWGAYVPPNASVVSENRCHLLLRQAGLPVAEGELATDVNSARRIARDIGFPVVMKGISDAVTHRGAAGLLAVDLRSEQDVADAFQRLEARAAALPVNLDGIYVQRMVRGDAELLVAVFRDVMFGTMVSVGPGGGMTEYI